MKRSGLHSTSAPARRSALRRERPMPRPTQPIARHARIRERNPARRTRERERAYGSPERRAWVRSQPCLVTGCGGASENVHVRGGEAGRKSDARHVVPGCRAHHDELHHVGVRSFEARYGLDLPACAAETERAWRRECTRRGAA